MLLGIPGDNTYSNYLEANRTFWRQTVLPLADAGRSTRSAAWLAPAFGDGLRLRPDIDAIEALSTERAALWQRVEAATFLTLNEKRAAIGYGPVDGGDRLAVTCIVGARLRLASLPASRVHAVSVTSRRTIARVDGRRVERKLSRPTSTCASASATGADQCTPTPSPRSTSRLFPTKARSRAMPRCSAARTSATTWCMPGAFRESLQNAAPPASSCCSSTIRPNRSAPGPHLAEDSRGLYARGQLLPDVARAREVLSLMRAGALDGLSIGFRTVDGNRDRRTGRRRLDKVDLWEISVVTFPMQPEARIETVKVSGRSSGLPTEREFERWLTRDAGLTRSTARAIIRSGFRDFARKQDAAGTDDPRLADVLGRLRKAMILPHWPEADMKCRGHIVHLADASDAAARPASAR